MCETFIVVSLSKVCGEVVVGSIQSVWRKCSRVYPKCMEKVYSGLSKVYGEVVVGSIQSVWRRCSLVYPKCMENALVLPCTKGRDGRPGMHESTPAEECVRSKSWSVPAHVSIGYIIRGLADAPSPEGEGRRESAQPQGVDGMVDVVGGWRGSAGSHW